jgi:hypothetical protein
MRKRIEAKPASQLTRIDSEVIEMASAVMDDGMKPCNTEEGDNPDRSRMRNANDAPHRRASTCMSPANTYRPSCGASESVWNGPIPVERCATTMTIVHEIKKKNVIQTRTRWMGLLSMAGTVTPNSERDGL